jgi:hypothetical protein
MTNQRTRFGRSAGLVCLLWGAIAAAGVRELPAGAMLVEPENWKPAAHLAQADAAAILRRVAEGDAVEAYAEMQSWGDPQRFELAAVQVIDVLQAQRPTAASLQLLDSLQHEPVRLWRRHEETAADWFMPLFDIASRAESARRLLAFNQDVEALVLRTQQDPRALGTAKGTDALVATAMSRLPDASIEAIATQALRGEIELPSPAWTALARRRPRLEVLQATTDHADAIDLLPLLQQLTPALAPRVAFEWLQQNAMKPEIRSAAVLGIGTLAPQLPEAAAALEKHLGNPESGASAAAAIARLPEADRMQRIDALLAKATRTEVVADLALALRLEGSDKALQRLRALESDPRLSAAAKAELQR